MVVQAQTALLTRGCSGYRDWLPGTPAQPEFILAKGLGPLSLFPMLSKEHSTEVASGSALACCAEEGKHL